MLNITNGEKIVTAQTVAMLLLLLLKLLLNNVFKERLGSDRSIVGYVASGTQLDCARPSESGRHSGDTCSSVRTDKSVSIREKILIWIHTRRRRRARRSWNAWVPALGGVSCCSIVCERSFACALERANLP